MIQQLTENTGAAAWAIASMVFFIGVFALVVVRVFRTSAAEHQQHASLPLDDGSPNPDDRSPESREVCDG